jgi:N-dimethylarginine dimethylaminohydrolase
MCPPTFFEVSYEINSYMHVDNPVDTELAKTQWNKLHNTYASLGYDIQLIQPVKGIPDLIFTANAGLAIDGKVAVARFKNPERQGETPVNMKWFKAHGYQTFLPKHDFEGEGDCLYSGGKLFAGSGYRTDPASHAELAEFFGREVVSLRQIDPRFYHLDVAMCPLTEDTLMYFPGAFDDESIAKLKKHFRYTIEASEEDATGFGLNAVSDGENVVLSSAAFGLTEELKRQGFNPIGLNMSEFRKSGGAVKCCTMELREAVPAHKKPTKKIPASSAK